HRKVQCQVRHAITGIIPDFVAACPHTELVRLGSFTGDEVDVDRGAAADRGQQQLDRGEVGVFATTDGDRPAAGVLDAVTTLAQPLEIDPPCSVRTHAAASTPPRSAPRPWPVA